MSTATPPTTQPEDREGLLRSWLDRMAGLVEEVKAWTLDADWSVRVIDARVEDREVGNHRAAALVLQRDTVRILLQPIGRSAPDADGVADFYLMPAWDDIVRLYHTRGRWWLLYPQEMAERLGIAPFDDNQLFDREAFDRIVAELVRDAA